MQPAKNSDSRKLNLVTQRYRVMHKNAIIGQFSNTKLADRTVRERDGAIVLDMSVRPPKVVYKDGKWLEKSA